MVKVYWKNKNSSQLKEKYNKLQKTLEYFCNNHNRTCILSLEGDTLNFKSEKKC